MLVAIKGFCTSNDLNGEFLIRPLKNYHNFLAKKIENSANFLSRFAWRVAYIAYPILGLLAGVGLLLNLTNVYSVLKHNKQEKKALDFVRLSLNSLKNGAGLSDSSKRSDNFNKELVKEITLYITPEFPLAEKLVDRVYNIFAEEIDSLSGQFKKGYLEFENRCNIYSGTVDIKLFKRS